MRRSSPALDATFIGPNPAINAYAQSDGEAIRIVSGATSGGAFLVVRPDITAPADLAGAKLATPQLGNTQDVALRVWLRDEGFATDTTGGGDVSILPQENAATLDAFKAGEIDGACRSRGQPASCRRAAARCSSTSATCGPPASTSRRI